MQDNIDNRIEQWMEEQADNLRVTPSEGSWEKLTYRLEHGANKKRPRRMIWKIAASFALLIAAGAVFVFLRDAAMSDSASALSKRQMRVSEIDLNDYSSAYDDAFKAWIVASERLAYQPVPGTFPIDQ